MVILVLYVDDLLLVGSEMSEIEKLKKNLTERFEMSDCGELKCFLGMKIKKSEYGLKLSQQTNIERILEKFGMSECNTVKTLLEKNVQLKPKEDPVIF